MLLGQARPALAQEDARAAAVAVFDEARRLIDKKQIPEACQKFGESQHLDPQLGTLLHWADCLERNGQTASAWARFRDASELAAARKDRRQTVADERATKLFSRLSKLQIDVDLGNEQDHLKIERDGVLVSPGLWSTATPVDPGRHTITASAPGRKSWTGSVLVTGDASTATVRVPLLERTESAPVTPKAGSAPAPAPVGKDSTAPSRSWLGNHWPALAVAGVGLVGIGLGTAFGLSSKKHHDDAQPYCDGQACSDPRGVTLKEQAIRDGNVSTVAFIVGGVGLATAGVLLVTLPHRPDEERAHTAIVIGPSTLGMRGYF
jgi:hypothetical protein